MTPIPNNTRTIKLNQMCVSKNYQNQKFGSQLLEKAEIFAQLLGYEVIELESRDNVLDFYKKHGYEIVGDEFFEKFGMKHFKMLKVLRCADLTSKFKQDLDGMKRLRV